MERFTGRWKNEAGNLLIIKPRNRKSLSVSFISHLDNRPVKREFADNRESVDMPAELDFYETSLEVELWDKGKGFHLSLTLEILNNIELIPGISRYEEDKFLNKYYCLFYPLARYVRIDD